MRREDVIALLGHLDRGEIECLPCPSCMQNLISVWFTNPAPEEYRIWLICKNCNFESKVICSEKPTGFSAARIHQDKQLYDTETLKNMIFPKPKS